MKFVTVRDFRSYPKKVWKELDYSKEVVITNNGKPFALLTPIIDSDLEYTLKAVRQALAKRSAERIREISVQKGYDLLSETEINKLITDSRK